MNALKAIVEGRGDGSEEIKLNFFKEKWWSESRGRFEVVRFLVSFVAGQRQSR